MLEITWKFSAFRINITGGDQIRFPFVKNENEDGA